VGANLKANNLKYGNNSKNAPNWICGPNHEIRYQQVPGYTCHVPGVKSENLFAKSFARTTATANSNKRFNRNIGQKPNPADRYLTHNQREFGPQNFRRFLDSPALQVPKDYQDYASSLNREKFIEKNKILSASRPDTVSNICSKTSTNFFDRSQGMRTKKLATSHAGRDLDVRGSTIKPKLLESKVLNQGKFFSMSDGFQRIFANDKKDVKMIIPISGYKGHKRGDKSQNFFGRSFRDCAIQSKKLERSLNLQI
jgi:hypothetical protein